MTPMRLLRPMRQVLIGISTPRGLASCDDSIGPRGELIVRKEIMLQRRASVRFMPLSLIGTLWGVSALAVAQSNGETTLAAIRAVAGESKPAIWESENPPPISITTVD